MEIRTVSDLRRAFRNGPYAWPGGYPCLFVMSDGDVLSFRSAKQERRRLLEALRDRDNSGWRPVAFAIDYENDADAA
jgi:hypothetical protein